MGLIKWWGTEGETARGCRLDSCWPLWEDFLLLGLGFSLRGLLFEKRFLVSWTLERRKSGFLWHCFCGGQRRGDRRWQQQNQTNIFFFGLKTFGYIYFFRDSLKYLTGAHGAPSLPSNVRGWREAVSLLRSSWVCKNPFIRDLFWQRLLGPQKRKALDSSLV